MSPYVDIDLVAPVLFVKNCIMVSDTSKACNVKLSFSLVSPILTGPKSSALNCAQCMYMCMHSDIHVHVYMTKDIGNLILVTVTLQLMFIYDTEHQFT